MRIRFSDSGLAKKEADQRLGIFYHFYRNMMKTIKENFQSEQKPVKTCCYDQYYLLYKNNSVIAPEINPNSSTQCDRDLVLVPKVGFELYNVDLHKTSGTPRQLLDALNAQKPLFKFYFNLRFCTNLKISPPKMLFVSHRCQD